MPDPVTAYFRPVAQGDPHRPAGAHTLAGGWCWFTHVERISRTEAPALIPAAEAPQTVLERLTAPRAPLAGLDMGRPRLMGILNVTPDSFSDGGLFMDPEAALAQARAMQAAGADIIDVGGESTRPGAVEIGVEEEVGRTAPVIAAIRAGSDGPVSIDTRKSMVARAAMGAGASMLNDVSAFSHDSRMAPFAADSGLPICLMHAQGTPQTMQDDPTYDDVLLDVYDLLAARIAQAEAAGLPRDRIVVDPGIGFGKTLAHNLALLRRLSLFHALGCPVLLGASRKRFIGSLSDAPEAKDRLPGSLAVALHGLAHGVQILRVHDTAETRQALQLADALRGEAA
jgi:dihydropteroate synthase